jgi:hypothetical protein
MKPAVKMTAKEISIEIFGGNYSERYISEKLCFKKGFPKFEQEGTRSKKFWNRNEIYAYYKAEPIAA